MPSPSTIVVIVKVWLYVYYIVEVFCPCLRHHWRICVFLFASSCCVFFVVVVVDSIFIDVFFSPLKKNNIYVAMDSLQTVHRSTPTKVG